MNDAANDFARLFRIEGIGQVLVTIDEDEESEKPCLCFRLPSVGGLNPSYSITSNFPDGMPDDVIEQHMREALAGVTEDMILAESRSMMDMVRAITQPTTSTGDA
ncbi:hypothetical protein [Paracoccus yeei]|uniref:Uncharacterized protein n=1 Tax=Paracoccus yeei TaxID=147645 RepID=A0A5P2QUC0_9RHOB|nr:hypothetical protein [Paracoccus yeei]QEU08202.1 hypothetical protein FOB51_09420 [Paracoccus yeei]